MISVVVVSLNEADKLKLCLASVKDFAKEIIVIDLESKDKTKEVSRQYKAKIFEHPPLAYVEPIRNFAISKATQPWVLILDPDEQVSASLATRLVQIAKEDKFSAVNIPRKNIFFGHWIAHTNFWPDRHIRFFKKGVIVWPDRIHAHYGKKGSLQVSGLVLTLPARQDLALKHYGYDNRRQVFERQKRYAAIEAQNRFEEGERFSPWQLFWMPTREFAVRFIKHLGFLDGFDGLFLVMALMYYQILVQFNLLKLQGVDKK